MDLNFKVHSDNNVSASPFLSLLPLTEQYFDFFNIIESVKQVPDTILESFFNVTSPFIIDIPLAIEREDSPNRVGILSDIQKSFEKLIKLKDNLSIGYPIVIIDDLETGHLISAPLFTWKVNLNIEPGTKRLWNLTASDNSNGSLNPLLQNYFENRFEIDWEEKIGKTDTFTRKSIEETCISISDAFNLSFSQTDKITPCTLASDKPESVILNAFVLGNFEPIVNNKPNDIKEIVKLNPGQQWKNIFATLPLNSIQDEFIKHISKGHQIIIEGAANTGKTHTISSVLPYLLASGASALIISSNSNTFNHYLEHLDKVGVSKIGILELYDSETCNNILIEYLESLPKRVPDSKFDFLNFEIKLNQLIRLKNQLQKQYNTADTPIIHNWKWVELVGKALLYDQKSSRQILTNFLDTNIFDFSAAELKLICDELSDHYLHYQKFGTLNHSLNQLNDRFFNTDSDFEKITEQAKADINIYHYKIKKLYQNYLVFVGDYTEFLRFEHTDFVDNIENQIKKIENDLQLYQDLYGDAFDRHSNFQNAKLKLLSMFSKRHQGIRLAKDQIAKDYDYLKIYFFDASFFDYTFPEIGEEPKLADIKTKLEEFRIKLHEWATTIDTLVGDKLDVLSHQSDIPISFREKCTYLEHTFNNLLVQLNKAQILDNEITSADSDIRSVKELLLTLSTKFQKILM
ncbi:hypothetical protein OAK19_02620 [Aureispira]|nr:hypothetical protein [Aureispira sp.]